MVFGIYIFGVWTARSDDFIANPGILSPMEYVLFFLFDFPRMLIYFNPIIVLFANVFVLSRLNMQRELIAIHGAGLSTIRLLWPTLLLCIGITFTVNFFHETIYSSHKKQLLLQKKLVNEGSYKDIVNNITLFGSDGQVYFAEAYNPNIETLMHAQILYLNPKQEGIEKLITAPMFRYVRESNYWVGSSVFVREWDPQGKLTNSQQYGRLILDVKEEPYHFEEEEHGIASLSAQECKKLAEKYKLVGGNSALYFTLYHCRKAFNFVPIVVFFLGVPLSVSFSRNSNFLICLLLVLLVSFFFYCLLYIGQALGEMNLIPAFLAGWLANIVTITITYIWWHRRNF